METFIKCQLDSNYLIGDNGTVKSLFKQRYSRYGTDILIGSIKSNGYKQYYIKNKWYYSHRLVAIHFINNSNNWVEVNHIDGNKLNNNKCNLEWATRKLNHKHRFEVLGQVNKGIPKGFKHSNETKLIMSVAKLGRKQDINGKWL